MAMSDEKIAEVVDALEAQLPKQFLPGSKAFHVAGMIPRLRGLLEDGRREKAMRWIGFIQGYLWSEGLASLEDLKRMNMPEGTQYDENRDK